MMGQRAKELKTGFVLVVADIPRAFDEFAHPALMQALRDRGVHEHIIAWFIGEIRKTSIKLIFKDLISRRLSPPGECRRVPNGALSYSIYYCHGASTIFGGVAAGRIADLT